jgi:hypothetical protein
MAPANGPDCIELSDPATNGGTNYGFDGCGTGELVVTGPMFKVFDVGIEKQFNVKGSLKFRLRAELLNALNIANFAPVATASNTTTSYEVTGLNGGPRVAQLVARFTW